ncbi:hypothetical protein HK102_012932 [Quaeritorhiza haematococci]|nr:hypothetical protein HK102_012932 [Quaeritorhiza haematococci]
MALEHHHIAFASFFEEADECLHLIRELIGIVAPHSIPHLSSTNTAPVQTDFQHVTSGQTTGYDGERSAVQFTPGQVIQGGADIWSTSSSAAADHHEKGENGEHPTEELILDRLSKIFDKYQEQPHLLDPHLERLIDPVIRTLRDIIVKATQQELKERVVDAVEEQNAVDVRKVHYLFRVLYVLTKVRGYKTNIVDHKAFNLWETRYVLLLWLSLICRIPFDLRIVDSGTGSDESVTIVDRIMSMCKSFLSSAGKEHEGAALLLARLLTRKDTVGGPLLSFLQWCTGELRNLENIFLIKGILATLCYIYKYGQRDALLPTLQLMTPCCQLCWSATEAKNSALFRKLLVKLTQRIGLCYLPPRVAAWRYRRGNRSMAQNLHSTKTAMSQIQTNHDEEEVEGPEIDVPEDMEGIIELMLNGLRDKDTIVRWSAAKGLGRITNRLPRDLAQEVIMSVVELFGEDTFPPPASADGSSTGALNLNGVSDSTWHGACLAVAELARRGLLLPTVLVEVIPWVVQALKFDLRKGSHSIGAHVRDAACYVCWSFARAYAPEIMRPFVSDLAKTLVIVSVFDREVNIRRASSAAFQENVGRQGIFPNGIEIVTAADYFAVGNRVNSFTQVGVHVAGFDDYRYHLIDHCANVSVVHWDRVVRELAARTLYKLTRTDVKYMMDQVFPRLLPKTTSADLSVRHGALLAVGEICLAWASLKKQQFPPLDNGPQSLWWTDEEFGNIIRPAAEILLTFPGQYLETFGSDLTRHACCRLVACLAKADWPVPSLAPSSSSMSASVDPEDIEEAMVSETELTTTPGSLSDDTNVKGNAIVFSWLRLIHTCLERREESVQEAAVNALTPLGEWIERRLELNNDRNGRTASMASRGWDIIAKKYMEKVVVVGPDGSKNIDKIVRRGYALAVGVLPPRVLGCWMKQLTKVLQEAAAVQVEDKSLNDAESRRNAIIALTSIILKVGDNLPNILSPEAFGPVWTTLLHGLDDYSTDSRGDVGSWVREACLRGLDTLVRHISRMDSRRNPSFLSSSTYESQLPPSYDSSSTSVATRQPKSLFVPSSSPSSTFLPRAILRDIIGGMLKQSVGKIDRVRETAGTVLYNVIWNREHAPPLGRVTAPTTSTGISLSRTSSMTGSLSEEAMDVEESSVANLESGAEANKTGSSCEGEFLISIEGGDQLRSIVPRDLDFNWLNPADVFKHVVKLLVLPFYRIDLLEGLVVSVGGLTESLVRQSSANLVDFLDTLPVTLETPPLDSTTLSLQDFFAALFQVFLLHTRNDRVSIPILEVLDLLSGCGALGKLGHASATPSSASAEKSQPDSPVWRWDSATAFYTELLDLVRKELFKSRDVKKLHSGIKVLCGFVALGPKTCPIFGKPRMKALGYLVAYLVHPYPKVRRGTAEQLHLVLTSEPVLDDAGDEDDAADGEDDGNNAMMEVEELLLTTDCRLLELSSP